MYFYNLGFVFSVCVCVCVWRWDVLFLLREFIFSIILELVPLNFSL